MVVHFIPPSQSAAFVDLASYTESLNLHNCGTVIMDKLWYVLKLLVSCQAHSNDEILPISEVFTHFSGT